MWGLERYGNPHIATKSTGYAALPTDLESLNQAKTQRLQRVAGHAAAATNSDGNSGEGFGFGAQASSAPAGPLPFSVMPQAHNAAGDAPEAAAPQFEHT